MNRLFYISLAIIAMFCMASYEDDMQSIDIAEAHRILAMENIDNAYSVELLCCRDYNSDMLMCRYRSASSFAGNNLSSVNNSVRSRHASHHKSLLQASHECHAGHVVQFFDFNHFRSSLRIVYYLYALCRLRI